MELKGYKLTTETIGLSQTQYLREYHATVLVKDVVEVSFRDFLFNLMFETSH